MTDLTAQEMIATILRSLEKTGDRFAGSKAKARSAVRPRITRPRVKSNSSRTSTSKRVKERS